MIKLIYPIQVRGKLLLLLGAVMLAGCTSNEIGETATAEQTDEPTAAATKTQSLHAHPRSWKTHRFLSSWGFSIWCEPGSICLPARRNTSFIFSSQGRAGQGYRTDSKACNNYPVKSECTKSKSGRNIFRSFHQEFIERVKEFHQTEHY